MIIAISNIKEIDSKYGGQVFRLDGHYVNEFGKLSDCYTFIDPTKDNFKNWSDVLYKVAEHKGMVVEIDNVKMKNREQGLLNADSMPRIEQVYPKTDKKTDNLGRPELFE